MASNQGKKSPSLKKKSEDLSSDYKKGKDQLKVSPKKKKRNQNLKEKTLIIVESPAKAKTMTRYLGKNCVIEASMGHIIDLPKSRMAIDVENNFQPEYITVRGRAGILNKLKKISSQTKNVLLAPDPDREGEAISWHLKNALEKYNSDIKRITFNEVTKDAIRNALNNPVEINIARVNAQQGRRVLDRIVGYNISPILWKKVKKGLSAGRVQSLALRMICTRETEIENFSPSEYWSLDVDLRTEKNKKVTASLSKIDGKKAEVTDEKGINLIIDEIKKKKFEVVSISKRDRSRKPAAPYTTSKLQQDGAIKLGFTGQKTMSVCQQLYEGIALGDREMRGLITYMRTDSTRVSHGAISQVRDFIQKEIGNEYLPQKANFYKQKKESQDAHEAIRPTNVFHTPANIKKYLTREQYRLYEMIWQKFVSSQMLPEISEITIVEFLNGRYTFKSYNSIQKFPGFTKILTGASKTGKTKKKALGKILMSLSKGELLTFKKADPQQHFTQPPPRFNDASLVKYLEESGVGRPSTYAPTINTLLKRYYVNRYQKQLKPTELGKLVDKIVSTNFPDLVNEKFTANMEERLDRVEEDNLDWRNFISDFYFPFSKTVDHAMKNIEEMRTALDIETDFECDKCGKKMVKRIGRFGYFLACPGFPECKNAKPIPLGSCPKCSNGYVIQRATKRGRPFYGCTQYPDCDFSTWDKPVEGQVCPKCGKLLLAKVSKDKGSILICSDEDGCKYKVIDKKKSMAV
jgi:DNA topoisomerase-1